MSEYLDVQAKILGIEFQSYHENDNKMLAPHNEDHMNKNNINELAEESDNNANDLDVAENIPTIHVIEEIVVDNNDWTDTHVENITTKLEQENYAGEDRKGMHNVTVNNDEH